MTEKIEWYKEVLELEPNSKVFFPLARMLAAENDCGAAIATLYAGLERHPEFLEARLLLIELLHSAGQKEQCDRQVEKLAEMFASYAGFWQAWAACLSKDRGQADTASILRFLAAHFITGSLQIHDVLDRGIEAILRDRRGEQQFPAPDTSVCPDISPDRQILESPQATAKDTRQDTPVTEEKGLPEAPVAVMEESPVQAMEGESNSLETLPEANEAALDTGGPQPESGEDLEAKGNGGELPTANVADSIEGGASEGIASAPVLPESTHNDSVEEAGEELDSSAAGADLKNETALVSKTPAFAEPQLEEDQVHGSETLDTQTGDMDVPDAKDQDRHLAAQAETQLDDDKAVVEEMMEAITAFADESLEKQPSRQPAKIDKPIQNAEDNIEEISGTQPAPQEASTAIEQNVPAFMEAGHDASEDTQSRNGAIDDYEDVAPESQEPDANAATEAIPELKLADETTAGPGTGASQPVTKSRERETEQNAEDYAPGMDKEGRQENGISPDGPYTAEDEPLEETFTLRTRSMADVLAEQGDIQGALDIYNELAASAGSPAEADEISSRIDTLTSQLGNVRPVHERLEQEESMPSSSREKLIGMLEALAQRVEARAQN